jgi:2-polyprenyl-3-methyl-5-hydroxy-6-metoxy-1,4-benzoquinol methylase
MASVAKMRGEQSYWDQRYKDAWDKPYHGVMAQWTPEMVAAEEQGIQAHLDVLLRRHHRVLDAACGYGRLAPMICARVKEYVGVDWSQQAIDEATAHAPENARFYAADLVDVTDDKDFDVIVMSGVMSSISYRSHEVINHLRSLLVQSGVVAVFEYGSDRLIHKNGDVEWLT